MIEGQPTSADLYAVGLRNYVELTHRIQQAAPFKQGLEEIIEIDRQRIELHTQLDALARSLGKTPDDVLIDRIAEQGTMEEFGINAPLVRLPFFFSWVGRYSRLGGVLGDRVDGYQVDGRSWVMSDNGILTMNGISFESDEHEPTRYQSKEVDAFTVDPRRALEYSVKKREVRFNETGWGDTGSTDIETWLNDSYFAIIYLFKSSGMPPNYDMGLSYRDKNWWKDPRIKLAERLATDLSLRKIEIDGNFETAHQFWSMQVMFGIEVPAERLVDVGTAISRNPQLYWDYSRPYS